jgi:hypothetical protein
MTATASKAEPPAEHCWTIGISTLTSYDREQIWRQQRQEAAEAGSQIGLFNAGWNAAGKG